MEIRSATFTSSFVTVDACPAQAVPEFAFIGRSNVGKSSLINMLCGRKDLVKVSQAPGKTRTINFFLVNDRLHFVDLPGYGYARVSQQERKKFETMIFDYLEKRRQLQCLFLLIDSRHEPQQLDLDFINSLGRRGIPFALVFTKADKQSAQATGRKVTTFLERMKDHWETLPLSFTASATTRQGREELLAFIDGVIRSN